QQFTGEAKFIRAFLYFYLVNYFGDVPLVTVTDVKTSQSIPRTPIGTVYVQIEKDLIEARSLLAADYSRTGGDRARANSGAASALLSRVYLYEGKWSLAEAEAGKLIGQTALYGLVPDPNNVFLSNSREAILQFYNFSSGYTYLAGTTVLTGQGLPLYAMRSDLVNAFETGDARATKWVGTVTYNGVTYKFPYKLKVVTNINIENETPLRLGEQYLIRAEARMQQSNFSGAKADIDAIRSRASLTGTTASDKPTLTTAIEHERQVELFYEWGHRWLDLKRTGRADIVLRAEKPAGWQASDVLLPVPATAISTNTGLTQNDGYK
ncbi:MAG: RagB/SusD family nutrient uptake outer membrane protein, partial [Bacteroidetes bacterium]|nr:RagB/SusD family nutrient uptake outer membrane protein [Bacteroidota bacterium]